MSKKKPDEPKKSDEQRELERRVDAMMSTEASAAKEPKADAPSKPKKTAPKTPPKSDEPPIVIALSDDGKSLASTKAPAAQTEAAEPEEPEDIEPIEPSVPDNDIGDDAFDDDETDEAVDDIIAREGDTQLAVDDALAARRNEAVAPADSPSVIKTLLWFIVFLMVVGIAYVSYRYAGL